MINELAGSPTRSENVYFANNEQASIAVFTAVFCFTHAENHLIKLKLYKGHGTRIHFFEIFSKFKYFGDILIMLHEE